jgi:ubiquinone/menaquinone biosynthesis C-methylase UbiE
VSLYSEIVVPRLVNLTCGTKGMQRWRERACAELTGVVVEIGFGSGTNVEHLPASVERLYAIEPSGVARKLAAKRIDGSPVPIDHIGLDGEDISLPDESCDSALCTFTLCTVPHPDIALRELLRVLKPGGTLHYLEHGLAPDASVAKWQRRIDPIERRIADGCLLTRDPAALIKKAGFETVWAKQRYVKGPKPWSFFSTGVARKIG